jgi:hypothetical protein
MVNSECFARPHLACTAALMGLIQNVVLKLDVEIVIFTHVLHMLKLVVMGQFSV